MTAAVNSHPALVIRVINKGRHVLIINASPANGTHMKSKGSESLILVKELECYKY